MITRFDSLFAGHVDLDNLGYDGTPVNDRWLSDEHIATVFDKAQHIAELMDLLRLGPEARTDAEAAGPGGGPATETPRWRDAAVGTLWTVGIICVFPQGLVPVAFNLFGVDPQVRVWFAARYAPQDLQLPVAAGFIAVGLLASWWAEAIRRRPTERRP